MLNGSLEDSRKSKGGSVAEKTATQVFNTLAYPIRTRFEFYSSFQLGLIPLEPPQCEISVEHRFVIHPGATAFEFERDRASRVPALSNHRPHMSRCTL
jgi:hypothetical protein